MVLGGPAPWWEVCLCFYVCECIWWEGGGVLRRLEWLLGCLFYQKDCSKAFHKHSTEAKLSNQIHWEIKGYVWLNPAPRRSLDISLLGKGNWFLAKVFYRSHHGWWIKLETTENLDRVYLRQIVIHHPNITPLCLNLSPHKHKFIHTHKHIYQSHLKTLKYEIYQVLLL